MGLYIKQDVQRSELQTKIISDLQEKTRATSMDDGDKIYDDSPLLKNQHETRSDGVIIALLIMTLLVVIIFVVARSR